MAFTSPEDPICLQEGTALFGFIASGTIKKGQCLKACGTMLVKPATTATDAFVGVAAYDATNGEEIAVWGPGNIVKCIVSGSNHCTAGDDMHCAAEGKVTSTGAATGTKIGVALETQTNANGTARILLV